MSTNMSEPTCIDLRPWAKAHRYRWRFEESYLAEKPENRGDGRWYVEVLCKYGLIYPYGGNTLLAYANRGMKRRIAGLQLEHHQTDGDAEVFRFAAERLDEVAAILKPKRLKGSAKLTREQLANLQEGRKRLETSRVSGSKTHAEAEQQGAGFTPPFYGAQGTENQAAPFITDSRSY